MNNEINNNTSGELNVKPNNSNKIIVVILVLLLVGALGFICYDKFINKEKPSEPNSGSTDKGNTNDSNNSNVVSSIKMSTAGDEDNIVLSNGKTLKYSNESGYNFTIGDKLVDHEYQPTHPMVITDKYIVFLEGLICDNKPDFAVDLDGNIIDIEMIDLDFNYDDTTCPKSGMMEDTFKIENGRVVVESRESGILEFIYNGKSITIQAVK